MSEFRDRVYELVGRIPEGRLMTYGQVAALCGSPRAALIVGQIAHFGESALAKSGYEEWRFGPWLS